MCVLPLEIEKPVVTIQMNFELVKAYPVDLKELDYYKTLPNGEKEGKFKFRQNLPFWLINSKGEFEHTVYVLSDKWNPHIIKEYLDNEQIYISSKDAI